MPSQRHRRPRRGTRGAAHRPTSPPNTIATAHVHRGPRDTDRTRRPNRSSTLLASVLDIIAEPTPTERDCRLKRPPTPNASATPAIGNPVHRPSKSTITAASVAVHTKHHYQESDDIPPTKSHRFEGTDRTHSVRQDPGRDGPVIERCLESTRAVSSGSARKHDPDQGSAHTWVGFEPRNSRIAGEIHGGRDGHDFDDRLSGYQEQARRGYPRDVVAFRATSQPIVQPRR